MTNNDNPEVQGQGLIQPENVNMCFELNINYNVLPVSLFLERKVRKKTEQT